jgi:hypothetical protein
VAGGRLERSAGGVEERARAGAAPLMGELCLVPGPRRLPGVERREEGREATLCSGPRQVTAWWITAQACSSVIGTEKERRICRRGR